MADNEIKVGDRVKWCGNGPYTVIFVGKQVAVVERGGGTEFAAWIGGLTLIPDTVTIEIPRKFAEVVAKHWRGVGMSSESVAISDACRAALCRAELEGEA